MRGSNPRPLAHKTNTLPTELMEHVCGSWVPASLTVVESRVRGLVVMIVACQVMDPGSIPGERIFFSHSYPYLASPGSAGQGQEQVHPPTCQFGAGDNPIFVLPRPSTRRIVTCIQSLPYSSQKKRDPRNRSRTSDLEISIVAIYSLPLCQLSYTRIFGRYGRGDQTPTHTWLQVPGDEGHPSQTSNSRNTCSPQDQNAQKEIKTTIYKK